MQATDADGGVSSYTYDAVGNRAGVIYPNGAFATYTYDSLNRLTLLENNKDGSGDVISSYAYTLGLAGNRTRVVEDGGRTVDYTYDNVFRLVQEDISYNYNAVGNYLSKDGSVIGLTTYVYDDNDRLIADTRPIVTNTYSYGDNGNMIARAEGTGTVPTHTTSKPPRIRKHRDGRDHWS